MNPLNEKRLRNIGRFLAACLTAAACCSVFAASGSADRLKAKSSFQAQKFKQSLVHSEPSFQDVTVHDPSVIEVDGTYYVFGSHLAAAKTTDLMNWELIAAGVHESNPLFVNAVTEMEDIYMWSGAIGLWANNVTQLNDGRFYMYPNLSQGDAPRASIGLAIADDVEGPYTYQGIFLQSGMWGEISEDGENVYDPLIHPNTIDPHVFYDQEGKLWMVYGSYSGGIFILEMDSVSGLPLEGQGYGKHLMGGNHSRIEGPYIIYSPHTGYYYLFVSFGGLAYRDGYNIRVARSLNPDGPFYDAMGINMADVKSNPDLPLFDDESIAPFGQKLFGDHFWTRDEREPGTAAGHGYSSPGHNSVFFDASSRKYFLVFHSRFPGRGEQHEVRVHEMFMNAAGWPVVAPYRWVPYRYVPYRDIPFVRGGFPWYQPHCRHKAYCWNVETIALEETIGEYKLINHGKAIIGDIVEPVTVYLNGNGSISGEVSGNWVSGWGNRITVELDGIGIFEGVMSRGWNETSRQFVVTLSAQSVEGVSIWASQLAR